MGTCGSLHQQPIPMEALPLPLSSLGFARDDKGRGGAFIEHPWPVERTAGPHSTSLRAGSPLGYAPLRGCDFLSFLAVCGRKAPKSILPTSIAGGLRLRAINHLLFDRSARRFAQDDAFSEGTEKHLVGCKKREKIEKVTGSQDDKGEGSASIRIHCWDRETQVAPLRYAPVRMTIHIWVRDASAQEKLPSRKSHRLSG